MTSWNCGANNVSVQFKGLILVLADLLARGALDLLQGFDAFAEISSILVIVAYDWDVLRSDVRDGLG
jgi:hypothetical protein